MQAESSELDLLLSETEMRISEPPERLISKYAERRVLPQGTPSPGLWSNKKTPYLVDFMDDFSPWSPVQEEAVLKGSQLGFTAASENIICFWIDQCPTAILFVSATEDSLKQWAAKRMEPAIDSFGLRERMSDQSENKSTHRRGDATLSKDFSGGSLRLVSAQAAAALRSTSQRLIIKDELDGAPKMLKTGEGNFSDVADARASSFGARKKILNFSTPGVIDESLIWQKYLRGNQMKFFVECIHCHQPQDLELLGEDAKYGLKGEFEKGKLLRAVYICKFCEGRMYDHNKMELLQTGKWIETVNTGDPKYISRQINSLYSPEGWLSWDDLYRKYLTALETPDSMRSFKPLYLGMPYEETGTAPKLERVIENRGTYRPRDVPQGVLYICAGADVQEGSAKDPDRPARIEIEVCGFGYGMRSWSLCYETFRGEVDDPLGGAWAKMNEWALAGGLSFSRADGVQFPVNQIFIDSGYIPAVVYRFCSLWQSTFPSKGFATLTADAKRKERGEIPGSGSYIRKRAHQIEKGGQVLYEINTSYYKSFLYTLLRVQREPLNPQKSGFCDFPYSYPEEYFKQLTAAKMLQNRTFHSVGPDEALDCRCLCLAASEVYLENYVLNIRAEFQRQGAPPHELQKITTRTVIDKLIEKYGWPPGLPIKGGK